MVDRNFEEEDTLVLDEKPEDDELSGIVNFIEDHYKNTESIALRRWANKYMDKIIIEGRGRLEGEVEFSGPRLQRCRSWQQ